MNRSLQSKGSKLNREAGNIHTSTIFLVIVIIIALASAGLVIWQVYYGQHHATKNTPTTQSNEQSQSNKANETVSQSNASSQSTVQPDNSLAEHFNQICADPNQGIDQEMCSDINKQLRYDVARLVAGIQQARTDGSLTIKPGDILLQNNQSANATINSYAAKMSKNIKTATVVDQTDEAMVGRMDFGDVLVETNSECADDHFSAVKVDDNGLTATTRFYNTPLYYCQEIK